MVLEKIDPRFKNQSNQAVNRSIDINKAPVLEGKTLQVYWYLITNGIKGIRDIQKDLNFSSSSIAFYHIKKLMESKVVVKFENTDKYMIDEEIKTGILSFYMRVGFRMIPRFTLYLIIHLAGLFLFIGFLLFYGVEIIFQPLIFLSFIYLLFGTSVFIYESRKILKIKPDR
jgi:hypothetical protein